LTTHRSIAFAVAALAAGCTPELVDTTALVDEPAVLAVQASPAEVLPGGAVTLRALDVGPGGPSVRGLDWAYCTRRPTLTTPGTLSPECYGPAGPALVALGGGPTVTGALPRDACQTFGPDQPTPLPGQPAGRPADADGTGGYYQPVRILPPEAPVPTAFGVRALCNLAGATPAQQAERDRRYRPNANPAVAGLALGDGTSVPAWEDDQAAVTSVSAGAAVTLAVSWPTCPSGPGAEGPAAPGCGGAEPYVWFDPVARSFTVRAEEIVVSWFATAGRFATARTGRTEAEAALANDSENLWTAPASPGDVWLWVVLRDPRGGVGWGTYHLRVTDPSLR
jgi:hypothetical protein